MEQLHTGKTGELDVHMAPGGEENGMAVMLSEMIKANIRNKPERQNDFDRLKGTVWITAEDADVKMTMVFNRGSLTVHDGHVGTATLAIATDSETLLDLAKLNIRFGMPWYFDEVGLGIIKKLLKRELKIKGLLTHTMALTRLSKIMSIN